MNSGGPPRDRDDFRGGGSFGRSAPPPVPSNFRAKGSAYRAMVKNLPMSASWQDLKVTLLPIAPLHSMTVSRGGIQLLLYCCNLSRQSNLLLCAF